MDRLQAMEVFARVVETASFTRTAERLGLPKATVSTLIRNLEAHLGVKLLNRTTRRVNVTTDGAAYYERCVRILAEVAETEHALSGDRFNPHGRLRVDVGASFGRRVLVPALPDFFARYPDIRLDLGCSDRPVDLIDEGIDCVVRGGGGPLDPSLVARRVGQVQIVFCATPGYLAGRGVPRHPLDLEQHHFVNYFATRFGKFSKWNFNRGEERIELTLDGIFAVDDGEAYLEAGLAGLGVFAMATFMVDDALADGRLVRVLEEWTTDAIPIYLMYPAHRHLSAKVRVFVDWVGALLARYTEGADGRRRPPEARALRAQDRRSDRRAAR